MRQEEMSKNGIIGTRKGNGMVLGPQLYCLDESEQMPRALPPAPDAKSGYNPPARGRSDIPKLYHWLLVPLYCFRYL